MKWFWDGRLCFVEMRDSCDIVDDGMLYGGGLRSLGEGEK